MCKKQEEVRENDERVRKLQMHEGLRCNCGKIHGWWDWVEWRKWRGTDRTAEKEKAGWRWG